MSPGGDFWVTGPSRAFPPAAETEIALQSTSGVRDAAEGWPGLGQQDRVWVEWRYCGECWAESVF